MAAIQEYLHSVLDKVFLICLVAFLVVKLFNKDNKIDD